MYRVKFLSCYCSVLKLNFCTMFRTLRKSLQGKKHNKLFDKTRSIEWEQDKEKVHAAKCSFLVKYLGSVEVRDCRGMHICEQAMKELESDKKKKVRAILYISTDALKVVENSTKALLLDQTIEKVSFCAPNRNNERAFSYICRDGTTQRWLCHSFIAVEESTITLPSSASLFTGTFEQLSTFPKGERLSHAVGCAFAACLEKRQHREKSTGVKVTYDKSGTTFFREGSFRVSSTTEQQEQSILSKLVDSDRAQVCNPSAIPRPHAPLHLIRQASLRQFGTKTDKENNLNFPFKRHYSVQVNKLPSTITRRNFNTMHPVPELEEANNNSDEHSRILSDNHSDDSSSTAPSISPVVPTQANSFKSISKPSPVSDLQSAVFTMQQADWTDEKSPLLAANTLTTSTQQQALDIEPTNNMSMQSDRRMTSEADQWLNTTQWQAGIVPMATTAHFPTMVSNNTAVICD